MSAKLKKLLLILVSLLLYSLKTVQYPEVHYLSLNYLANSSKLNMEDRLKIKKKYGKNIKKLECNNIGG